MKTQFNEQQFNGIILDNSEDTKDLTIELAKVLTEESRLYTYFLAGATFYDIVGVVYFIGAFLFKYLCFKLET